VVDGTAERGVLVCGSGTGMAIAANRHTGVRAVVVRNEGDARLSRQHNNSNVICFGARVTEEAEAANLLTLWLEEAFAGGRHERRVEKIDL
jgi:ribose 5-phosphate isomerase B